MDHAPLVSTYTFPVSRPTEIRAVCNPSIPLLPEDEVLHENLSSVQGGARFEKIEKRIRMADGTQFVRELVTGLAGSGKSTELLRLAAQLRTPKETKWFHVVHLDIFDYLSQWGIRLPHIIIALLAALAKQERDDLKDTRSAKTLLELVEPPEVHRLERPEAGLGVLLEPLLRLEPFTHRCTTAAGLRIETAAATLPISFSVPSGELARVS